ncbi:MAG: hypothetical protein AAF810_06635 [Cyanobacteria bacterium P01_D01_bin.36]
MQQHQEVVSLTEIEAKIQQLPKDEIRQLVDNLQAYLEDEWDKQIESDANSGKLDSLIAEAELDIAAGNTKRLDEVINNL